MMNQERLTEALSAYLDGALDGAERDALERHLATCEACRAELAGLRRVGALLRALPEPALPRSFTLPVTTTRTGLSRRRRAPRAGMGARGAVGWAAWRRRWALGCSWRARSIRHHMARSAQRRPLARAPIRKGGATTAPGTSRPSHTPEANQSTGTSDYATARWNSGWLLNRLPRPASRLPRETRARGRR